MGAAEASGVIRDLRGYIDERRAAGAAICEVSLSSEDLKRYAADGGLRPQIVLKSEAYAELGGPKLGSRAAVLATSEDDIVVDGRVTLLGPDEFAAGEGYAWGVALLMHDPSDLEKAYLQARRQNLGNAVPGCMLKSPLDSAWCRVGASAAERGLRPADLAGYYLARTKEALGGGRVEVVMELAPPHGLGGFASLLQHEGARYAEVMGRDMSTRGVDLQCAPGAHCGSCSDKSACAEVRKIHKARNAAVAAECEE